VNPDDVEVHVEFVRRAGAGSGSDALRLTATNRGAAPVLVRGAALQFPTGLRHVLPGEASYPRELAPRAHTVEHVACVEVVGDLAAVGLSGRLRLQALFVFAPDPMDGVFERLLSARGSTQGWGPAAYSAAFTFDTARWSA
jgi:hypothetical protein